jgi:hypothetical protein
LNPLEIEKTTTKTPRTSWNIQMSNPNWNSLNYQCYILANKSNTLNKHPNRNHEQQKTNSNWFCLKIGYPWKIWIVILISPITVNCHLVVITHPKWLFMSQMWWNPSFS